MKHVAFLSKGTTLFYVFTLHFPPYISDQALKNKGIIKIEKTHNEN